MPDGGIFPSECPSTPDLLEGTGETTSLSLVCKLSGHDIVGFRFRDRKEPSQTHRQISSMGWREDSGEVPNFVHLSPHANEGGLATGPACVTWEELAELAS